MSKIYYITGLGGKKNSGLALYLAKNYSLESVLEIDSEIQRMRWSDQKSITKIFLKGINQDSSVVIASSYGAYLLLNSLIEIQKVNFRMILISPVIGLAGDLKGGRLPKGLKTFKDWVNSGEAANKIRNKASLICGNVDPICPIANIDWFNHKIPDLDMYILKDQNHSLNHEDLQTYLCKVL